MYQIILASGSPRRKEILEQAGVIFRVIPSLKEEVITTVQPDDVVKELALLKASDFAEQMPANSIIIGADTVVANAGKILGKPIDELDAVDMIMNLQGHSHTVHTGVCIIVKHEDGALDIRQFAECTKVHIADITKEEAMAYSLSGEPLDKAGAYAIQGKFAKYVQRIEGDYYNVVGFPISRFCSEMKRLGFQI